MTEDEARALFGATMVYEWTEIDGTEGSMIGVLESVDRGWGVTDEGLGALLDRVRARPLTDVEVDGYLRMKRPRPRL